MTESLDASVDDFHQSPWLYPGTIPDSCGVLRDGSYRSLSTQPSRRLGQACVDVPGFERLERLNFFLLDANVAAVDQRFLVVAVGSNAAPAVMRRKFGQSGVSTTVPFVRGVIEGMRVGHSAHVSRPGYIAATPVLDPSARTEVMASLLDREQLAVLDETEPNYRRVRIAGDALPLQLDGGERPDAFYLYDSRWGALTEPGGEALPLMDQEAVFALLARECAPVAGHLGKQDPRSAMRALAADPQLREDVKAAMADAGWARPSGVESLALRPAPSEQAGQPLQPEPYGRTASSWADSDLPDGVFRCWPSPDDVTREGEQCVTLADADAEAIGRPSHVVVSGVQSPLESSVLARLVRRSDQPAGTAGVDQVIRNALGLEVQEHVRIAATTVRTTPAADRLVSRPHFSMMRVQAADLATVEQNVGLLDPLAMSILGVEDGDEVVVQGCPDAKGRVPDVRVRAHATPEDTLARRDRLSGGGVTARFPGARDALAVHPDLPWIFLDASTRARLNVGTGKLAAVRVRASRRFQVTREIRELLLVLVLAFVGLASVVKSRIFLVLVLVGVFAAAMWVTRHRLKNRLESSRE